MTALPHPADRDWIQAKAFIVSLENRSHGWELGEPFFSQTLRDLCGAVGAQSAELWLLEAAARSTLAAIGTAGAGDAAEDARLAARADSAAPAFQWHGLPPAGGPGAPALRAAKAIDHDLALGLTLVFAVPGEAIDRERMEDLVAASLEILAAAYLRAAHRALRQTAALRSAADDLVQLVERESSLTAAAAALCRAVAGWTLSDRVSLLRIDAADCCLLASSTQPHIDRRTRQVRLMQALIAACATDAVPLHFIVGRGEQVTPRIEAPLHAYLAETTVREVRLHWVASPAAPERLLAAVLVENFILKSGGAAQDAAERTSRFVGVPQSAIGEAVAKAVATALWRHQRAGLLGLGRTGLWRTGLGGTGHSRGSTKLVLAAAIAVLLVATAVPVELRIRAEGRIVPALSQRLFAPTEAVVSEVLADNGQSVAQGDPLVVLRSPALDLARQQLLGELATVQVRLSSVLASRTRGSAGNDGAQRAASDLGLSASEEALKVQSTGLQAQLALLDQQLASLQIVSPLDGVVHRWDLKQSLQSRPVAAGHYLLDVVATDRGWLVELEIPDREIGYLLDQRAGAAPRCRFHLRSHPELTQQGVITSIDRSAQVNQRGESFVRAVVPFAAGQAQPSGGGQQVPQSHAGVVAWIDCGQRPLAFVWLRGFFQWLRVHVGW